MPKFFEERCGHIVQLRNRPWRSLSRRYPTFCCPCALRRPRRERIAAFASQPAEAFAQLLINEYRQALTLAGIATKPLFEEVAGVSLLASCSFRPRRKNGARWDRRTILVEPRSAYLMAGPWCTQWEHSIPQFRTTVFDHLADFAL